MFRENVLTNDAIIRRVSSTMVPVALDYQKLQDPATQEAQFLRPLMKPRGLEQGVWIFSPHGNVLASDRGEGFMGDLVGHTNTLLDESLKVFGPVAPRRVRATPTHPHRGTGVLPGGGVCLAECVRTSDDALRYMHPKSPVLSSVTLSAQELTAFAPPKITVGTKWSLPEAVTKRLARVSSPLCYQHAPQPSWITAAGLSAEVRAVDADSVWIAYEGSIASEHRVRGQLISDQKARLEGYGVYHLKSRKMDSLLLVGAGTLHWPEAPQKRVTFDALVQWERGPAQPHLVGE